MGIFSHKSDKLMEEFSIFQGMEKDLPIFATINIGIKKYSHKKNYPWFFGISIVLKHQTENGLPNKEEIEDLDLFENKIKKIFSETLPYIFTGRSSWNSHRELMFYTTEPKKLVEKFNKLNENKPEFKFSFRSFHDPKWKTVIQTFHL